MKRIVIIISLVCAVSFVLAVCAVEGFHLWQTRQFVGYGPHIDVVLGNSDIGRRNMYYARYWNVSAYSVYIEGCRLPGGYVGEGILYRWDVQRWNATARRWDSLRGADNWVPTPFSGYGNDENCVAEMTRIPPLGSRVLGWVQGVGDHRGASSYRNPHLIVTCAVSTPILYTTTFVVDRSRALPPAVKY